MSASESKKHAASDQKLDKQRKDGNVASVAEISAAVGTIISLALLLGMVPLIYERLTAAFELPTVAYDRPLNHAVNTAFPGVLMALAMAVSPIIIGASIGAILTSLVYNKGIVFSMKPLEPKLDRISPVAGFKRMFGKRTWVEVTTALVRLMLWFAASAAIVWFVLGDLFELDACPETCASDVMLFMLKRLLAILVILLLIMVLVEMIIQKKLFLSEQKMTDTEVKKEQKDNYGSNEVRQERSRLRQEDGETAEASGADKANMCFYFGDACVAIRYHPEYASEPKVAAKALTAKKAMALRQQIEENGFQSLEHEALVAATRSTGVSKHVPVEAFEALIDGLKRMFGNT